MQLRALNPLLVLSLSVFFPACSGGASGGNKPAQSCGQSDGKAFCLISCSLGCSTVGCDISRISQNERLTLTFSEDVDRFSVPTFTASILMRTQSGDEPIGEWLVNGNRVTLCYVMCDFF